ncbi:hypothetical protein PHAVU_009G116400 [Phaseolus vulgaris]|uniref:Uncharacterized protein n=1 Tax=Phaseolus vulgaris TaxID=3885 RepID=V7AVH2_PHAVU|nr:hypothetical protein PHAVU_009G116400g [Phaseolus vulgaris]ESW09300.1 hypothetical protein PHAVU_009G116400g [Phaseolus vulgaris]
MVVKKFDSKSVFKELVFKFNLATVSKHLMKTVSQLGTGNKPVGTTTYMARMEQLICNIMLVLFPAPEDWLKPNVVLEAFEARAARMCVACAQNLSEFSNPEESK